MNQQENDWPDKCALLNSGLHLTVKEQRALSAVVILELLFVG